MEIKEKNGKYYKKHSFSKYDVMALICILLYGIGSSLYLVGV